MAGPAHDNKLDDDGRVADGSAIDEHRLSRYWLRLHPRWLQTAVGGAVTATIVLGVFLAQSMTPDSGSTPKMREREQSIALAMPELACSDALLQQGTFDYWAPIETQTLEQAVGRFVDSSNGESASINHLSDDTAVAIIHRRDGSARAQLNLQRDDVWYVDTVEACAGDPLWPNQ